MNLLGVRSYRLAGSWTLRVRLRSAGLKVRTMSSGGRSVVKEDDGSTSSEDSAIAA